MTQLDQTPSSHPSSIRTQQTITITMIPKTIVLLLAVLVACIYAAAPIPANKISPVQPGMEDLDIDLDKDESLGPDMMELAAERYLKEENIEFEPDAMLEAEDRGLEGFDEKMAERGLIKQTKKLCYKVKYKACKLKKLCCCRFTKKSRKKCKRKCKKKAKKKCSLKGLIDIRTTNAHVLA